MGFRFTHWVAKSSAVCTDLEQMVRTVMDNRQFESVAKLAYGDHGLSDVLEVIHSAIQAGKKIALYADYDVDGTMSCVSWIWYLESIGFHNYVYYIPDRFQEGYGVNLDAVKHLVQDQGAELIITMDTGITANVEAAWCKERQIPFICTDHHKVQVDKMPDCLVLNPKMHPDPLYQELCGAGITFVLLRQLAGKLPPRDPSVWVDILALVGMATICDVVPLNGVNHRLAQQGVQALLKSQRPVIRELLKAARVEGREVDESDVGFKLGPRINAVGRLEHAHAVIEAFIHAQPDALIREMGRCNDRRKDIQRKIVDQAMDQAPTYAEQPVLFMGGDWHQGVVGIAASKLVEEYWKPVWLFDRGEKICKGSARSIPGFDVTDAMSAAGDLFLKFGGHAAAGGFSFEPQQEEAIRDRITRWAEQRRGEQPQLWQSQIAYDAVLDPRLLTVDLPQRLAPLRPFGHSFEAPLFKLDLEIESTRFFLDKQTKQPKHTAVMVVTPYGPQKIMFFNRVLVELEQATRASFLVQAALNRWQGRVELALYGEDYQVVEVR
ncbi:MAG: DHHA1 domain-containing protein [Zetaproteobacteria bacterium]|nr:DHHA1 domain-containing protein [Zetaproteobacteria bacterium]